MPSKKFKNEAEFTSWFGKNIRELGGFWHKISDLDVGLKPCDAIMTLEGVTHLIEFKIGDEKAKCEIVNKLRPNQVSGLLKNQKNGGSSLVIYYNRLHHQYWIYDMSPSIIWLFGTQPQ